MAHVTGNMRTARHFIFRRLDLLVSERSVCEPSFLWVADVPYQASTLQLEQLVIMVSRQMKITSNAYGGLRAPRDR